MPEVIFRRSNKDKILFFGVCTTHSQKENCRKENITRTKQNIYCSKTCCSFIYIYVFLLFSMFRMELIYTKGIGASIWVTCFVHKSDAGKIRKCVYLYASLCKSNLHCHFLSESIKRWTWITDIYICLVHLCIFWFGDSSALLWSL